ncbi:PAS domain-containing sensor histidine kinase [Desulfovibrio litoralis]|uniref:histidine kinase n=1 Tax=Desulfovibrio litoralis DSM 11393 TaxID=1121455 RepID=A0A1M7T5N2_9BACT|nr:PAS domain-containing sensor histidine kinase [Desulfovibrio litoralis]SHN66015.1 hypothetical protein SAMN02745728_01566 [Desulfovibrio litoralis DSM 11393]
MRYRVSSKTKGISTAQVGNLQKIANIPTSVQVFLNQLFELQEANNLFDSYAASIILSLTNWDKDTFYALLLQSLSSHLNLVTIESALLIQKNNNGISNFVLTFLDKEQQPVFIQVSTRNIYTQTHNSYKVIATLSACPKESQNSNDYYKLKNIIDHIPGYVVLIDQNHNIVFANKAFSNYFGSIKNGKCYEIMKQNKNTCTPCNPFEAFKTGTVSVTDWSPKDRPCAFRVYSYPFDDLNNNKLLLQVGLDITSDVKTQVALNQSEERYRTVSDNLSLGLAVMGKNQLIGLSNLRLQEWFGSNASRGKAFFNLFHDEKLHNPNSPDSPVRLTFETAENHECETSLIINNEQKFFRLSFLPIKTPKGNVRAVIAMLDDITERKKVEYRLAQVKRLEGLSILAAGIAHEINQPLSAVHLYSAGLKVLLEQKKDLSPDKIQERLDLILKEASKIKAIISNMRALALQEKIPDLELASLEHSFHEVKKLLSQQLNQQNIKLINHIDAENSFVLANKVQLEQVFLNIIKNSIDAFSKLNAPKDVNRIILVRSYCLAEPKQIILQFIDNGPGLKGDEDKIFNPFFSSSVTPQNMGLGLSIVHTFVESWGAEIIAQDLTQSPLINESNLPEFQEKRGSLFQITWTIKDNQE